MEISVRTTQKLPKILGIHDDITVEEGTALELVCEMFYGFDRSIDPSTQLNWIHNHTTIQLDPDSSHHIDLRNKWEKCEHIGEAIFDIPFMIQSHAESMKKILGAL